MFWWYKLIKSDSGIYQYAYSCDSKRLDGVIEYSEKDKAARVVKACEADKTERRENRALSHFFAVVRQDFPEEWQVCCG